MNKLNLSVVVLTYNEEKNLRKCLESVFGWVEEIFVVDSFSTDRTLEIAKEFGAKIYQHKFENQAKQFNWALENLPIKTEWILRLDADEYVLPELKKEILEKLPRVSSGVSGFLIKRRVYFMGKWIKYGGYYPTWLLRIFRRGKGFSEDRAMDEHILVKEGKIEKLENDFVDNNQKGLSFWIEKHNNYAKREAEEALRGNFGTPSKEKYYKLPIFLRAFLYYFYRYFFKLGFLDGKEGLIFHFLHGLWYRFLVDCYIFEAKK